MGSVGEVIRNRLVGKYQAMSITLTQRSRQAWSLFLNNRENRGHAQRSLVGENIDEHVLACMGSSKAMAKRVRHDLAGFEPANILEVGSSTGLNCYALQMEYPYAKVTGLEPEAEAVVVAQTMTTDCKPPMPKFVQGVGEDIPLADKSVDLIICHTVIEHVQDVGKVIHEFSRVLADGGIVHLDAPNYLWPYEPHLQVWTIPKFGKRFVKWSAMAQGKTEMLGFIDHLQFVTTFQLQRTFRENGLIWENRAEKKLVDALNGAAEIKKYKFASRMLFTLGKLGISRFITTVVVRLGFYPSVMFTLRKTQA